MIIECNDETIILENTCLLIFIDETGTESLNDPNCPIFGLGGCATLVSEYERLMAQPWKYMKQRFFDMEGKNLHATDLRKPTKEQINALNHFFTKFEFSRFAVTLGDSTSFLDEVNTFHITAQSLWHRITEISQWYPFTSVSIIFEDSQRGTPLMQKYFIGKELKRNEKKIPINFGVMSKENQEAGLEIADFVIHTAGRQARLMNSKVIKQNYQLDFEKVFKEVNQKATSFLHITGMEKL